MKKIDITLQNREMQEMWFEEISTDVYEIKTTSNYALNYARLILDKNKDIVAFDPSGGPLMRVGSYKIGGKILRDIRQENGKLLFITEFFVKSNGKEKEKPRT
jgi:hypothetical protein